MSSQLEIDLDRQSRLYVGRLIRSEPARRTRAVPRAPIDEDDWRARATAIRFLRDDGSELVALFPSRKDRL